MTANRIRDFVLYIAIGLLVGLLAMWLAFHSDRSGSEVFKWPGLAVNTAIVFGYAIKFNRILWKRRSFWMTLFLLLFVHLFAFVIVLRLVDDFRPVWWIVIVPMESVVIGFALTATGHQSDKSVKR
ncbi:MAG: hypothetical protein LAP61_21110 [Acidobacteriia bacterium]|nr:hypothetical protein [Terriglobia bacterium]